MKKAPKLYPIETSCFYGLESKRKLAELLQVSLPDLHSLKGDCDFLVRKKIVKGKERDIQEPLGLRKTVHKRLQKLLSRIQAPEYLFSGKKGISSLDNAKHHVNGNWFLTLDIEKFFPSCKKEHVFRFFSKQLQMVDDVAWVLADIVCYRDTLPTGSHLSQTVAYWAFAPTFDRIASLAKDHNIRTSNQDF